MAAKLSGARFTVLRGGHQLARIYILTGEPDKAVAEMEALLKIPYYLSAAWLKIDPNFDPALDLSRLDNPAA